jgi:hypothetical protein
MDYHDNKPQLTIQETNASRKHFGTGGMKEAFTQL